MRDNTHQNSLYARVSQVFILSIYVYTACSPAPHPSIANLSDQHPQEINKQVDLGLNSNSDLSFTGCNDYLPPVYMGNFQGNQLREISGLSYSLSTRGLLWAHNDAGSDTEIIAINERGASLMSISLPYENADLEDLDMSKCPSFFVSNHDQTMHSSCLWVGDIGDNEGTRDFVSVYVFEEPNLSLIFGSPISEIIPPERPLKRTLNSSQIIEFRLVYPDSRSPYHNAEALMVDSTGERIWLIEKTDQPFTTVWYAHIDSELIHHHGEYDEISAPITLNLQPARLITNPQPPSGRDVSDLNRIPNQITASDFNQHGDRLLLRTYFGVYEYRLNAPYNLSELGNQPQLVVDYKQLNEFQGEAISYGWRDEGIWSASEAPRGNQPISWIRCKP